MGANMKIKNAIKALHKERQDVMHPLYTTWGEQLNPQQVWTEYPRPQLKRDQYKMVNGYWDYKIEAAKDDAIHVEAPFQPDGEILVPFSPEAPLSGVNRQLQPNEYLWYQREILFSPVELAEKDVLRKKCLLHFGAADQKAWVYLNGNLVASHIGGYLPFTVDITDYILDEACLVQVRIQDVSDTSHYTRGKQTLKRGGMFYTAQSGLWQSVWYEWVPENFIHNVKITPYYDDNKVSLELYSQKPFEHIALNLHKAEISFSISAPMVERDSHSGHYCTTLFINFDYPEKIQAWTTDTPSLYHFTLVADEDNIESYFAMRTFTLESDESGTMRFCLNHKPLFLHGILDQGYWPDGLMTAPCDEAFIYDINLAKSLGFNMIRKHIKIEPLRWYYHCDRLGMIVWQDMVNGGSSYHMPLVCYLPTVIPNWIHKDTNYSFFSRSSEEGRLEWEKECLDTVAHLYNVPSLAVWVPFNEGWGQFDAYRICQMIKEKDSSRLVDHASGWFDQKGGDFKSVHNYFRTLKVDKDASRAFVISEYGGYACRIKEHSSVDGIFGYQKYETPEEFSRAYHTLIQQQLFPLEEKGLCGAVYTQLSDIEEEVNGLVTYDRKVVKLIP